MLSQKKEWKPQTGSPLPSLLLRKDPSLCKIVGSSYVTDSDH